MAEHREPAESVELYYDDIEAGAGDIFNSVRVSPIRQATWPSIDSLYIQEKAGPLLQVNYLFNIIYIMLSYRDEWPGARDEEKTLKHCGSLDAAQRNPGFSE